MFLPAAKPQVKELSVVSFLFFFLLGGGKVPKRWKQVCQKRDMGKTGKLKTFAYNVTRPYSDQLWPAWTNCDQLWPTVTCCDQLWPFWPALQSCDKLWPTVTNLDQLWPAVTSKKVYLRSQKPLLHFPTKTLAACDTFKPRHFQNRGTLTDWDTFRMRQFDIETLSNRMSKSRRS